MVGVRVGSGQAIVGVFGGQVSGGFWGSAWRLRLGFGLDLGLIVDFDGNWMWSHIAGLRLRFRNLSRSTFDLDGKGQI